MSDGGAPAEAVEQILASNDAWHRRDLDAVLAPYDDEIEWDTRDAWPDGRLYRGLASFRAYCEEVLQRWGEDEMRLDIEEILAAEGSASVVASYRMLGRSRAGVVPVDAQWVHVFEFREGKIVRGRNFTSLEAAAEALGGARLSSLWRREDGIPE